MIDIYCNCALLCPHTCVTSYVIAVLLCLTGLAIKVEEEASWKAGPHYVTPPENCFYCPLCLVAVEDSNDAWKDHLVHVCPQNAALMKGRK